MTFFEAPAKGSAFTVSGIIQEFNTFYETLNAFFDSIDGSYCRYQPQKSPTKAKLECGIFKPTNVLSISYGIIEQYFPLLWRQRQCLEYLKLALSGVSVFYCSQDFGTGLVDPRSTNVSDWIDQKTRRCSIHHKDTIFAPVFPASCPWVTSVGATKIGRGKTVHDLEVAASELIKLKGEKEPVRAFSSGGGFSLTFETPWYQQAAVTTYVTEHEKELPYFTDGKWKGHGLYNRNGRGYPDIAAGKQARSHPILPAPTVVPA